MRPENKCYHLRSEIKSRPIFGTKSKFTAPIGLIEDISWEVSKKRKNWKQELWVVEKGQSSFGQWFYPISTPATCILLRLWRHRVSFVQQQANIRRVLSVSHSVPYFVYMIEQLTGNKKRVIMYRIPTAQKRMSKILVPSTLYWRSSRRLTIGLWSLSVLVLLEGAFGI